MVLSQIYYGIYSLILGFLIIIFSKFLSTYLPLAIRGMPVRSKKTGRFSTGLLSKQGTETANEFFGKKTGKILMILFGCLWVVTGVILILVAH